MIIPAPSHFEKTKTSFVTWTAVVLNILIFTLLFEIKNENKKYEMVESHRLVQTGQIYLNYLKKNNQLNYFKLPFWLTQVDRTQISHMEYVGTYAIRDSVFLHQIEKMPIEGDQVEFIKWQKKMVQFIHDFEADRIFVFGLHQNSKSFLNWITYQFSHNQVFHLLSNLFFLILVGSMVENLFGSFYFILLYLFGGICGGFLFLNLGTHGAIPMIGASASISSLLAFLATMLADRKISFFYFISPFPQHYGIIYLPGWVIFPMILISDLANFFSLPDGLGAHVAHTAHLGGAAFGILFALILRSLDNILTKTQILKS